MLSRVQEGNGPHSSRWGKSSQLRISHKILPPLKTTFFSSVHTYISFILHSNFRVAYRADACSTVLYLPTLHLGVIKTR